MQLPPNQQLISTARWPVVGERSPRADDSRWHVRVDGEVQDECTFSLRELRSGNRFELVDREIDIHCVTRWSKFGTKFRGIRLVDLIDSAMPTSDANFASLIARSSRGHSTSIPLKLAAEALVAFAANDEPLSEEHGGPLRVVVPGRYFYKSVKWLERIELLSKDRLGYWESDAGYHNEADPWREQRYIASSITKSEAAQLIASGDFSRRDLRGLDCSNHTITALQANKSLLRDARFEAAVLQSASFRDSNLSNAIFDHADLQGADFSGADVEGASFVGADLRGADLRVASMFGASFGRVDESGDTIVATLDASTQIDRSALTSLTDDQLALFPHSDLPPGD